MEILDALERKVDYLLDEVASLRADKAQLEKQLAVSGSSVRIKDTTEQEDIYLARIQELEENLAEERMLRGTVLECIDAIVHRLEQEKQAG